MDFGQGSRQPLIYTVELDGDDIAQAQGLVLRLTPQGAPSEAVEEVHVPRLDLSWGDESTPAPPFAAEWTGILYVPEYGGYRLILEGSPEVDLYLDGSLVLDGPGDVQLPLAIGSHAIMVTDNVLETDGRTRLSWEPPKGPLSVVGPESLYGRAESHGLLGTYYPPDYPEQSGAFQRIDPMIFFFYHRRPFAGEFRIQWEGNLRIDIGATYNFKLDSNGPATLSIDGDMVIENPGINATSTAPHVSRSGIVRLGAGLHPITVTFQHKYK
jgi:hypothetical protein